MAIYHLKLTLIRRKDGRSAVAAAAYRAGERLDDLRTGQVHDYRSKAGVIESGMEGWQRDRAGLWNAAEKAEHHPRAIVAREVVVALPYELDAVNQRILVIDFAQYLRARHGMAIDWSIHAPASRNSRNYHAHLMLTTRVVGSSGTQMEAKTRELDVMSSGRVHLEHWRRTWGERVNERLWLAGFDAEIDHRSHKSAGRKEEAVQHLGPILSSLEAKGILTAVGRANRDRRKRNRQRRLIDSQLRAVRCSIGEVLRNAADFVAEDPKSLSRVQADRMI